MQNKILTFCPPVRSRLDRISSPAAKMDRTPSARLVRHAISQRSYARLFIHRLPAGHAGHDGLALHSWCHSFGVPEGSCPLFVGLSARVHLCSAAAWSTRPSLLPHAREQA